MKIANQTHGPLTLTKVEFYPRLSQETLAFFAKVSINGLVGEARNEGFGGPTAIFPREVAAAVEAYAKTLPPSTTYGMTIAYSGESLISEIVAKAADEAETAKAHAKYAKKGFKFYVEVGDRGTYWGQMPDTATLVAKFGEAGRTASIKRIAA